CILPASMESPALGGRMPDGFTSSIRTIHQCLRDSTRADHRRLESTLKLLDPELTRDRYRCVLCAFHGFYAPLEAQFRRFRRSTTLTLGFALPRRAALLRADLELLGCSPAASDDKPLREIQSIAEFAGRLY